MSQLMIDDFPTSFPSSGLAISFFCISFIKINLMPIKTNFHLDDMFSHSLDGVAFVAVKESREVYGIGLVCTHDFSPETQE